MKLFNSRGFGLGVRKEYLFDSSINDTITLRSEFITKGNSEIAKEKKRTTFSVLANHLIRWLPNS